jgi:peroxin-7
MFASASGDCSVKLWDTNVPESISTWRAHDFEVLSMDWNKYNNNEIVTASVDKSLRFWDIRKLDTFVSALHGHTYAVRRVRYSPHSANILASASYDMHVNIWDVLAEEPLISQLSHHSEFVVGVEWCLFSDILASCGWDSKVQFWHQPSAQ